MVGIELLILEDDEGFVLVEANAIEPSNGSTLGELKVAQRIMELVGQSVIQTGGDSAQLIETDGSAKMSRESALRYFKRNRGSN